VLRIYCCCNCIFYNEAVPVVDGNVFGFCLAMMRDIVQASAKRNSLLWLSKSCQRQPCHFNQAIMEFGALQCVPKSPWLQYLYFNESCAALQKQSRSVACKVKNWKLGIDTYCLLKTKLEILSRKERIKNLHNLYEFLW
jgi:A/G-specific adenine glycosylase